MLAVAEVDGEGDVLIGEHVPPCSVQGILFDAGDANALPAEALGVPGLTVRAPGVDGVEACEDEQMVRGDGQDLDDGLERNVGRAFRLQRIDDVGVASSDGAEFIGVGTGEEATRYGRVGEAEGAGGEEGSSRGRTDHEEKCASGERIFFARNLAGVSELAGRCNHWQRFEQVGGPVVREGIRPMIPGCSSGCVQSLGDVFEQIVDVLASGAEADEAFGDLVASPACATLGG